MRIGFRIRVLGKARGLVGMVRVWGRSWELYYTRVCVCVCVCT